MSAHTPGPWHYTAGLTVYALHGEPVRNRFSALLQAGRRDDASADELAANARLIAAAPDLLAFVASYLDDYKSEDGMYDAKHYAKRAAELIAKATGGDA